MTNIVLSEETEGMIAVAPSWRRAAVLMVIVVVTVLDSDGRPVPMGQASTARDGTVVTARLAGVLPPGTYLVRWQVTGSDGDLVDQEFRFAVGTAVSGAGATSHLPSRLTRGDHRSLRLRSTCGDST